MIVLCHCFCALFRHEGICDRDAVTTRRMADRDIAMCAPCAEEFDALREAEA